MNYNLYFFICICCLLCSCGTFNQNYEQGMKYVYQDSSLSESDFKNGLEAFDKEMQDAKLKIVDADISIRDQYSMIIALSWIGKAKLYQRMNKIIEMESACWEAIKVAEEMVRKHIQTQKLGPFGTYNVYFRREKIRRYAFNILHGLYQELGEKGLMNLMQLQMSMCGNYLNSRFFHLAKRHIHSRIKDVVWEKNLSDDKENISPESMVVFMTLSKITYHMSIAIKHNELESQYNATDNGIVKQILADRMQRLQEKSYWRSEMYQQKMDFEKQRHKKAKINMQHEFQTPLYALQANFKNLQLFPELQRLPSYHHLQSQAQTLDNYIAQHGFDLHAAKDLIQFRKTLDDVTQEAQEQAKKLRTTKLSFD